MSTDTSASQCMRYSSLDAWRGLAALAVVACHASGGFGRNPHFSDFNPVFGTMWGIGRYGYLGVHIFFAISGYCIAASLTSCLQRKESTLGFLRDRALRIYPVYWAAFAFFLLLGAITAPLIGASPFSVLPKSWESLLLNTTLLQPAFGNHYLLGVTWSLAYEVAFYFISAAGMLLVAVGLGSAWAIAAGTILAIVGLLYPHAPFPLNLWPEFFAGMLVFCTAYSAERKDKLRAWICGALLVILVFTGVVALSSPGWLWFVIAAGTAMLLLVLLPFDARITSSKLIQPLAAIGVFSYTLYLVHFSIVNKIMNLSKRFIATDSIWLVPVWLFAVATAVGISYLFYRLVEVPCEVFRKSVRKRFQSASSR